MSGRGSVGAAALTAVVALAASAVASAAPVVTEPPPEGRLLLPFGEATVTPTSIVAGARHQDLHVRLRLSRTAEAEKLLVRLYRPPRPPSPDEGRGIEAVTVETAAAGLRGKGRGSHAEVVFRGLNPPPGRYRLDFLTQRGGARQLAGRGSVVVYGQRKGPAGVERASGPKELSGGALPDSAKALVPGAVNHNVSSQLGEQVEAYVAVQPNNAARVIAGVNPDGPDNPSAWISDDFMSPGTAVQRTLPSSSLMPADEGGGVVSLSLCCDPAFAADTLGNLWYSVITTGPTSHVVVNRVAAGTTSFRTSNVAIPRFTSGDQDKNMMTIDNVPTSPKYGMLYVVWTENGANGSQNIVISECDTRPGGVSDPANCDTPAGWTEPQAVTDQAGSYISSSVAAAPNGDVYVVWWNFGAEPQGNDIEIDRCPSAFDCADAQSWEADTDVHNLDFSEGSGLPFDCPIISHPAERRLGPAPYVDVGPDGRVYVAFGDLRPNGTTKCTQSLTDRSYDSFIARGGTPGSFPPLNSALRLSDDDPTARNDHFFPTLAVDRTTCEVQSSFYSTKADGTRRRTHQYFVSSTDNGRSFSHMVQISTVQSDYSGTRAVNGNAYGDYEGAAAAEGIFYPAWADNRTSHGGDGELYLLTPPATGTVSLANPRDCPVEDGGATPTPETPPSIRPPQPPRPPRAAPRARSPRPAVRRRRPAPVCRSVRIRAGYAVKMRRGAVRIKLTAAPTGSCTGTLRIHTSIRRRGRSRRILIGSSTFSLRAGETRAISVRLTGRGRRLVRRSRLLSATASTALPSQAGASGTKRRIVIVAPARRR